MQENISKKLLGTLETKLGISETLFLFHKIIFSPHRYDENSCDDDVILSMDCGSQQQRNFPPTDKPRNSSMVIQSRAANDGVTVRACNPHS